MVTYLIQTFRSVSDVSAGEFEAKRNGATLHALHQNQAEPARAFVGNRYLIDLTAEKLETLRFAVNTIIHAESYLCPTVFPFVLVYEVIEGQEIRETTEMFMMFNLETGNPKGEPRKFWGKNTELRMYKNERITYRGSGRYYPVKQRDYPNVFCQRLKLFAGKPYDLQGNRNAFIGLEIVLSRRYGSARKLVYMSGAGDTDYSLTARGSILLHNRGPLGNGVFEKYKTAMIPILPLLSQFVIDKNGKVAEGGGKCNRALANLVSEFKGYRRRAAKVGTSAVNFRNKLTYLLYNYAELWLKMFAEINESPHNLNYSIAGYRKSIELYHAAEKICRVIANYFPNQLTMDYSKVSPKSNFTYIGASEYLLLEGHGDLAVECFDRMLLYVEWMRRNYVEYRNSRYDRDARGFPYSRLRPWPGVALLPSDVDDAPFDPYGSSLIHDCTQREWMEDTRETAGDIEQSHITFQVNSRDFMPLVAHFLRVCRATSYAPEFNPSGPLHGEIYRNDEMKRQRRRITPTGTDVGTLPPLPDLEAPNNWKETTALPNFGPLQIDERAIIKRCGKDVIEREREELDEPDPEDAPDPEKEAQWDIEEERRKSKKVKRAPARYRHEIDSIDPELLEAERNKMYKQIGENLLQVAEGIELAIDAFVVVAAPEATPLIAAKRVGGSGVRKFAKKLARELAEEAAQSAAENALDLLDTTPNFDPPPPTTAPPRRKPHEYDPPDFDDMPEFTGDEFDEIDAEEKEVQRCYRYAHIVNVNGRDVLQYANFLPGEVPDDGGWYAIWLERRAETPGQGVDLNMTFAVEPPLGRKLVHTSAQKFEDYNPCGTRFSYERSEPPDDVDIGSIYASGAPAINKVDRRPQCRYRCVRPVYRLPRP